MAGYNFVFNADSGFGALEPITADNFDLAYENYWGKSSSFTLGLFYKRLNGSIAFGEFEREFVNNGTTQRVLVRGPRNGKGGGDTEGSRGGVPDVLRLPARAHGAAWARSSTTLMCGSQASTTRNLAVQPGYTPGGTIAFGGGLEVNDAVIDSHRLAGLSDHSYNVVTVV